MKHSENRGCLEPLYMQDISFKRLLQLSTTVPFAVFTHVHHFYVLFYVNYAFPRDLSLKIQMAYVFFSVLEEPSAAGSYSFVCPMTDNWMQSC